MISFFNNGGGSGEIRGRQIATYLKAKLSPKQGYENDVCIYVKCVPPPNYPKKTYIDVLEDSMGLRWVKTHPEVGIIASSKSIYNHLSKELPNKIILIPQHHCNFEREIRLRRKVEIVGIIGNDASFQFPLGEFEASLNLIGLKLLTFIKKKFKYREEVVDFYKRIDIQVVWRPNSDGVLRNPLKLVNAMSYGIPTVAYPETDFVEELGDYFIPATTIDKLLFGIQWFKDNEEIYNSWSKNIFKKAEEYHIENISKLYLNL